MTLGQLLSGFGGPPPPTGPTGYGFANTNWIIILIVLAIILGFGNTSLGFGGFGFFNFRYPQCRACPVRHKCKPHKKPRCKQRPVCKPVCGPMPVFPSPIALIIGLIILAFILQPKKCC